MVHIVMSLGFCGMMPDKAIEGMCVCLGGFSGVGGINQDHMRGVGDKSLVSFGIL